MIKKISRFIALMLITTLLFLFFSGCWDYKDVEDRALVTAIGLDSTEDGKVRFDDEIAEFIYTTSNQTTYSLKHYFGEGKDFETARINLEVSLRNILFNGATSAIVISERYAREEGIESYLNRINKLYDIRKTTCLVISRTPTDKLFSTLTKKNESIGFFVEDNVKRLFLGSVIAINAGRAVASSRIKGAGYLLPCIDLEEGQAHYHGLAVIKDARVIDILSVFETTGILFVDAGQTPLFINLPDPKDSTNTLTFKNIVKSKKIKTSFIDNNPVINLSLVVNSSLLYKYKISPHKEQDIEELEKKLEEEYLKLIKSAIDKSQSVYECDIFEFIKYFKAQNPLIYRKIDWAEAYPKAEVRVNVKVDITDKNGMDYEDREELNKR